VSSSSFFTENDNLGGLGHISIDAIEDGHHNGEIHILKKCSFFKIRRKRYVRPAFLPRNQRHAESKNLSIKINKKNFRQNFLIGESIMMEKKFKI